MAAAQRRKSATRIPDVDPKSPQGVALTTAVQDKLRQFLGMDYTDRSLAQYVVVMLAHKTEQGPLGDNLLEFLGEVDAKELASWVFENLHELIKPEPAAEQPKPKQQQQQQQQQRQQQQQPQPAAAAAAPTSAAGAGAGGAAAEPDHDHDRLELEIEGGDEEPMGHDAGDSDGGEGHGSDADTADVALERGRSGGGAAERAGGGAGGGVRRLQSAVVRDEYRRRDSGGRRGRSRTRSRSPHRHRRSSYSPGGRRHSPPRRRSPPRYGGGASQYFWEGASGASYHGHDPYPYRQPGGWRGSPPPLPRRRSPSPPPPYGSRGHGRGQWGRPWSPPPRRGSGGYADEPPPRWGWGGPPYQLDAPGGGGGVFARMAPPQYHHRQQQYHQHHHQQHSEHDRRWEEEQELLAPPPGLTRARSDGSREGGREAAAAYDAGMGAEHLAQRAQQAQQAEQGQMQQAQQQLLPWERPSYMDLELQRQQQQQAQQQQAQQAQQAGGSAAGAEELAGRALVPAGGMVGRAAGTGADPAAVNVFARALTQAAASLGREGRSVTAVPYSRADAGRDGSGGGSGADLATFQVTITHGGGGQAGAAGRQLSTAPLLARPDLHHLLRQRLRQMELELVKLRAEQAERQLADVRQQQELSASAKLDLTVRTVCITGVHPAASERVLIAHFGACGYIQQVSFLRDPAGGRKTGVVYLQFSTAAEVQAALALNGSSLLQRTIQVVPSDSPAARVAASRVLRAAFPPPGLMALPMLPGPMPPPRHAAGRSRYSSGGGSGRGGSRSRGHGSFKYVREAGQPAPGSPLAGDVDGAGMDSAAPVPAGAAATVDAEHAVEMVE